MHPVVVDQYTINAAWYIPLILYTVHGTKQQTIQNGITHEYNTTGTTYNRSPVVDPLALLGI